MISPRRWIRSFLAAIKRADYCPECGNRVFGTSIGGKKYLTCSCDNELKIWWRDGCIERYTNEIDVCVAEPDCRKCGRPLMGGIKIGELAVYYCDCGWPDKEDGE